MPQLTIDLTGSGGLSNKLGYDVNKNTQDFNLRYDVKDNQFIDGVFNPLVRDGYLYPSNNVLRNNTFVYTTNSGDGYISSRTFTNTGGIFSSLYKEGEGTAWESSSNLIFGTSTGELWGFQALYFSGVFYSYDNDESPIMTGCGYSSEPMYDMEKYELNGTEAIYFVRGSSDVGVLDSSGTVDDQWLSNTADGGGDLVGTGRYAFLRRASNNFMYIFDENAIHKVDGTTAGGANGTVTMNGFVMPVGTYIKDAVDYRGNFYVAFDRGDSQTFGDDAVGQTRAVQAGVLVWDRILSTFGQTDVIPVPGINYIERIWIAPNNSIYLMCIGSNGFVQIRKFDGNRFNLIIELPFASKTMLHDSLIVAEGCTFWAALDGYLYCLKDDAVFKIARITTDDLTDLSGGIILGYSGASVFTADADMRQPNPMITCMYKLSADSTAKSKSFYLYGFGTLEDETGSDNSGYVSDLVFTANQGDVYTGVKLFPSLSTIQKVNIRCAPTGTGTDVIATVKYYFNQSPTASITKTIIRDEASRGYIEHDIDRPYVNAIQMEIEWSTSQVMGDNDFSPYIAVVSYETTNTRG